MNKLSSFLNGFFMLSCKNPWVNDSGLLNTGDRFTAMYGRYTEALVEFSSDAAERI
jgi:hypothetical protein